MSHDDDFTIIDGENEWMNTSNDDRLFAMLIYVTSFFTTIIGPILIWMLKREESAFIDFHGKEYFNFIISYFIYGVAAAITMVILIGFILAPLVGIAAFIFTIIAAIKAFNGEMYRIPFVIRFIK